MPGRNPMPWRALSLVPLLLVAACATNSLSPVLAPAPSIPPLPAEALQPKPPNECFPTCSAGLMKLRNELRGMLTKPASPASPAKGPTGR